MRNTTFDVELPCRRCLTEVTKLWDKSATNVLVGSISLRALKSEHLNNSVSNTRYDFPIIIRPVENLFLNKFGTN